MNRYREDIPYVFRPPKYSRFWAPLICRVSDSLYLRRKHRIRDVHVLGASRELLEMIENGDSLLLTPNHSDHSDPHTLLYWARRAGIPLHFMAARELFDTGMGIRGKVLQRVGVFSIDREGTDLRSIKEAMRIVYEGRFPLCMFPEGEIFHLNERLTPLNDGAATIMLRTARKVSKAKPDKRTAIIPVAIRYTYTEDISATFGTAMDRLERYIRWKPQQGLDIVQRIYKFGEALLMLKEKELLDQALSGNLSERLGQFREILINEMEAKYLEQPGDGTHPERVRRLRGRLRTILLGDSPPSPEQRSEIYRDLDRIYVAVQLYSYPGQYLRERPSTDRIAETILKFEEDLFGETCIRGQRRAELTFCPAIDMAEYLDASGSAAKESVSEVTKRITDSIRAVLEKDHRTGD